MSKLEAKFWLIWRCLNGPQLESEFRFHPTRKWRFDFADPVSKTAIELEGGIFVNGGHNRGVAFSDDCEKYNAAAMAGWTVIRLTSVQLRDSTYIESIAKFIRDLQKVQS